MALHVPGRPCRRRAPCRRVRQTAQAGPAAPVAPCFHEAGPQDAFSARIHGTAAADPQGQTGRPEHFPSGSGTGWLLPEMLTLLPSNQRPAKWQVARVGCRAGRTGGRMSFVGLTSRKPSGKEAGPAKAPAGLNAPAAVSEALRGRIPMREAMHSVLAGCGSRRLVQRSHASLSLNPPMKNDRLPEEEAVGHCVGGGDTFDISILILP